MKTYYYTDLTDDVVQTQQQYYQLPADYQIIPTGRLQKRWNWGARILAAGFGWLYSRLALRVKVVGKEKLKAVGNQGYFVYANHTQPLGDVFTPLTIFPPEKFYAIANQANWGIPFVGKALVRYGGLPVGKNLRQSVKLVKAIKQVVTNKRGVVMVYPEAHVWPYYTKIRPFTDTSFHFPVELKAPVFVLTTTYRRPVIGKRPRMVLYLDGPYYSDSSLMFKEAQTKLQQTVQTVLKKRAATSDYQYCHYVQKEKV